MNSQATIFIGSDHAGFALKKEFTEYLTSFGHKVVAMGSSDGTSCDYPPTAQELCKALLQHKASGLAGFGILICGTGIGMSITANRIVGIRAALCTHEFHAKAARQHNDANVLCLGERVTGIGIAVSILDIFMSTEFEGGRHLRRLDMIDASV